MLNVIFHLNNLDLFCNIIVTTWACLIMFCLLKAPILISFLFSQESVKTKHPQLLYESKLYKILQGGSNDLYLL